MHNRTILVLFLLIGGAPLTLVGCGGESDSGTTNASVDEAMQSGPPLDAFQDDYEQMAERLDLTVEESAALEAAWQQHIDQLEGWWAQHGETLVAYEAELKQAVADRELSEVRAATAKAEPLRKEFRALGQAGEVQIVMSLPLDQRKAWDGEQLLIKLEELIAGRITLSPEQKVSVEALAYKHAEDATPDLSVENRLGQSFLNFERAFEASVLTPEQQTIYLQIKDKNKLRSLSW